MIWGVVVVAAGRGVRFGREKQLIDVAGKPLVAWSLATLGGLEEVAALAIATEREHLGTLAAIARDAVPRLQANVVVGGAARQDSVRLALQALPDSVEAVMVHDGARPLVHAGDVRAAMALVAPGRASLLAVPVIDTIKVVPVGSHAVARTLERSELWAAQTPQLAMLADMRAAHAHAARAGTSATDDAALLEAIGVHVSVVPVMGENFKVTLPGDRDRAEALLQARMTAARA